MRKKKIESASLLAENLEKLIVKVKDLELENDIFSQPLLTALMVSYQYGK